MTGDIFNLQELRKKRERLRRQIDVLTREYEEMGQTLDDLISQLDMLNGQIAVAMALRQIPKIEPIRMTIE